MHDTLNIVLFLNHKIFVLYFALLAKPDRYYYRVARVGQTVKFPCETNLVEDVNWKRDDTNQYIYRAGRVTPGLAPRITVNKSNSNMLTILNVTANDSALYRCVDDEGHGRKHFYVLTVTG